MGKMIVQQIKNNYSLYTELLNKRKFGKEEVIEVSNIKRSNRNFITSEKIVLEHSTLPHEIIFLSEVKTRNYKYFLFKIGCNNLCDIPFFRYDSDGATHRNYDETIPLKEQQVTVPHFHRFNSEGISIAYKTKELLDTRSSKALEDINFAVAHFCHEGNIRVAEDEFPTISIMSKTLGLKMIEDDPNAGVNFL